MSILLRLPAPQTGSQFMEPERIKETVHYKIYVALSEQSYQIAHHDVWLGETWKISYLKIVKNVLVTLYVGQSFHKLQH